MRVDLRHIANLQAAGWLCNDHRAENLAAGGPVSAGAATVRYDPRPCAVLPPSPEMNGVDFQ